MYFLRKWGNNKSECDRNTDFFFFFGGGGESEQNRKRTCYFKIGLDSEICPNTQFNMLKFITVSLEELSSATIKFDV